ncbi:uncharacterized protein BXIN_2220 [Babesia sp. Xinjiang]|uniref:uncharacterized protein n=1 Tax=Babesia sp. Xinjiang TaxID=462227 RepID=UPI000A23733A|nr:uncharacterized protein BXIN_2220 [Babesia sp. Xinjiang]ORM41966.1 hypothetical protein BXIN_2220 [Babesia sp. Xinjiang]
MTATFIQLHTSLIQHPPGNLKECIDWVLRFCEKDEDGSGKTEGVKSLASELVTLFEAAQKVNPTDAVLAAACKELEKDKQYATKGTTYGSISPLSTSLAKFIGYTYAVTSGSTRSGSWKLDPSSSNGIGSSSYANSKDQYKSAYFERATWEEAKTTDKDGTLCARIFLGCLPVLFSGLSYLYWQCGIQSSRWDQGGSVAIDNTNNALGIFFQCCGYETNRLNSLMYASGEQDKSIKKLLDGTSGNGFQEFKASGVNVEDEYSKYIKQVLNKTDATKHPLSSLYICSTYYFQHQQTKQENCTRTPSTIREMLYWLMALPYSSVFQQLSNNSSDIPKLLGKEKTPSITFINGSNSTITFKLSTIPSYLLPPCFYAGFTLMTIQGTLNGLKTDTEKPQLNLHSIYSNSHFKFNYPDNPSDWFNELWNVVYQLMTQLLFLSDTCGWCIGRGCGWLWCQYASGIKYDNVHSWICTADSCNGDHNDGNCSQTDAAAHTTACGQNGTSSPLQACLYDKLDGFGNPKMGFNGYMSKFPQPRYGKLLTEMLIPFVDDKSREKASLYNALLTCYSVTLRIPRSTGDLFSFFYNFSEYYTNSKSNATIKKTLEDEFNDYHWNGIDKTGGNGQAITTALEKLKGNNHSASHPYDLYSLRECKEKETCGEYLDPISRNFYSIFAIGYADGYLRYVVHLAQAFNKELQNLLNAFNSIDCRDHKHKQCEAKCHFKKKCCCPTIVQCHGVYPLFYSLGFTFNQFGTLNGQPQRQPQYKRTCSQFSTQLSAVITGEPFKQLLKQINLFLLSIRKPFLLYLLTFWLLAITYLTYSLTIPLDVLHLRSHLRTAVPSPLVLLTNYTQPHDITYFQP